MKSHRIRRPGLELGAVSTGRSDGPPILFLHGMFQCHLSWKGQLDSDLGDRYHLVALDHRGHGSSDAPQDLAEYTDGAKWAGDVAATIDQLDLERPLIVAWSYSGYVVGDYLERFGCDALGGICFVCPAFKLSAEPELVGPGLQACFEDLLAEDLESRIRGTLRAAREATTKALQPDLLATIVGFNCMVSRLVRSGMVGRRLDFSDQFQEISVPTLVCIGDQDRIVEPRSGELVAELVEGAMLSRYADSGHMPFLEEAERFNRELLKFAQRVHGG